MNIKKSISGLKFPSLKELVSTPKKIRDESQKIELNTIKVRFFDRNFENVIESKGIISYRTSVPIVYFTHPENLGCILIDGCDYINRNTNERCVDVCEDYLFSIKKDLELFQELKSEYYNDLAENKLSNKAIEMFDKNEIGYYIPVLLNKIPREVIRIDTKKRYDQPDLTRKIEITKYLINQLTNIKLLERLEHKDNSQVVVCAMIFIPIGMIISFIITLLLS